MFRYEELESFSCNRGKVVLHRAIQLREPETLKEAEVLSAGRYIVLFEDYAKGTLTPTKFRYEIDARQLWADTVYDINPYRPIDKNRRILKRRGEPKRGRRPYLCLYKTWYERYIVHSEVAIAEDWMGSMLETDQEQTKTLQEAWSLYRKREKDLWPDNQKQK